MRPEKNDYAAYYEGYISKVAGDDPVASLEMQLDETVSFFSTLSDETAGKPYGEGKWSYKQTFGHVIDTERVMSYRALAIARGEKQPLPGFDQEDYVSRGNFNNRNLADLIEEYKAVRLSSLILFNSITEEGLGHRGIANNFEVTVLALAYIISGHDRHHVQILKKYYNG